MRHTGFLGATDVKGLRWAASRSVAVARPSELIRILSTVALLSLTFVLLSLAASCAIGAWSVSSKLTEWLFEVASTTVSVRSLIQALGVVISCETQPAAGQHCLLNAARTFGRVGHDVLKGVRACDASHDMQQGLSASSGRLPANSQQPRADTSVKRVNHTSQQVYIYKQTQQ